MNVNRVTSLSYSNPKINKDYNAGFGKSVVEQSIVDQLITMGDTARAASCDMAGSGSILKKLKDFFTFANNKQKASSLMTTIDQYYSSASNNLFYKI
jgi:hypothetical protein